MGEAIKGGPSDCDRPYRIIARHAASKLPERLKIKGAKWVAGVHRHTQHVHVHLLLQKVVQDSETGEKKRLARFPQEMLNDRDPVTGKGVAGLINLDVSEAIDSLLGRERPAQLDGREPGTARVQGTRGRETVHGLSARPDRQSLGSRPDGGEDPAKQEVGRTAAEPAATAETSPARERRADKVTWSDMTAGLGLATPTPEPVLAAPDQPGGHGPGAMANAVAEPAPALGRTADPNARTLSAPSPLTDSRIGQPGQPDINVQGSSPDAPSRSETTRAAETRELQNSSRTLPDALAVERASEPDFDEPGDFDR